MLNEDTGHIVCWATSVKHKNIAQQWISLRLIFFSHNFCHKNLRSWGLLFLCRKYVLFSFVQNWEISLQPFCHQARVNSTEELVRRQVLVRKSLKATEQRTTSPDFQCNQIGPDGSFGTMIWGYMQCSKIIEHQILDFHFIPKNKR